MKCSPIFHLDKEDDGQIGIVSAGLYNSLSISLGPRIIVFMTYNQALELARNLTQGLPKLPESLKHMTDAEARERFARDDGWTE